jgi:hypothetical protein
MNRSERIDAIMKEINETHKETLQALAESEAKELQFDLDMADIVWEKVKGYKIPEYFSVADRVSILDRYWHRAMEKEDI